MDSPAGLTISERSKLRANKIRVGEIHHHPVQHLMDILHVPRIRAMELFALSEFQSVPSVGVRFASDLISMGYYSLRDLQGKDPVLLLGRFEKALGAWTDPCVEDQFRLVVHHAQHPGSVKNWWDFTNERKAYREAHGYPPSRPKVAWFQLPRYKAANALAVSKEETRSDLAKKLKRAIAFMKQHLADVVTNAQLADAANLSQYHFIRNFRQVYDVTPAQFLTRLRLKQASLLLRKSELNIDEIMNSCGFGDKSSFIRLFRKHLRQTPLRYRSRYRENDSALPGEAKRISRTMKHLS